MSSWQEIQKLAADFQRIQLGVGAKKLSDRNCIELVSRLIEDQLIDVVYSLDGKEYITKPYLTTQIKNEVIGNGGRVALSEIPPLLGVESTKVNERVHDLVSYDPGYMSCMGQLITKEYLDVVRTEVQELLEEQGSITLSEITQSYDLVTELMRASIFLKLKGVFDKQDADKIYTKNYIEQAKARVRGSLSALCNTTKQLTLLSNELGLGQLLVFDIVDELLKTSQLKGILTRSGGIPLFTPMLYQHALESRSKMYFLENGYLELTTLKKFQGSQNEVIKQIDSNCLVLNTCILSHDKWVEISNAAEANMLSSGWCNLADMLPSALTAKDSAILLKRLLKSNSDWIVTSDDQIIFTEDLVRTLAKKFDTVVSEKAEKDAPEFLAAQRQQRSVIQDAAGAGDDEPPSGKGGRKKKGGGRKAAAAKNTAAEQQAPQFNFMNQSSIGEFLVDNWQEEVPDEFVEELADKLEPSLNALYREKVENFASTILQSNTQTLKHTQMEFEQKFRRLYQMICLADSGVEILSEFERAENAADTMAAQLRQFLLKTWGAELLLMAVGNIQGKSVAALGQNEGKVYSPQQLESAYKSIASGESKELLDNLKKTIFERDLNNLGEFYSAVDGVASPELADVRVKAPDRKTKAALCEEHLNDLCKELDKCDGPAAGLLLSTLVLFSKRYQPTALLHASGKFVPILVKLVSSWTENEDLKLLLKETQNGVVAQMGKRKGASVEDDGDSGDIDELNLKYGNLKSIVQRS